MAVASQRCRARAVGSDDVKRWSLRILRKSGGFDAAALNDVQIGSIDDPYEGFVERIYAENVYEWREGQVFLISDGKDTAA